MQGTRRTSTIIVTALLLAINSICSMAAKKHDPLCYCDGKPIHLADPCVFADKDTYYLTGTSTDNRSFDLYTSSDLKNWQYKGKLYEANGDIYQGASCFWAPEVRKYEGRYYLTFSCLSPKYPVFITTLAVSDRPDGGYRDLYVPWIDPKYSAIDCDIFVDSSGAPYLYYSHNFNRDGVATGQIFAVKMKRDLSAMEGEPRLISEASQDWERVNWQENRCNEGPWVISHKGKYLMTYSANDTGYGNYGIGVSQADSPLDPWHKYQDNPMLTTNLQQGVSSPGHNSIVEGHDGHLYIVYHRHADPACKKPNWDRVTCIERLKFTRRGKLKLAK